MWDTLLYTGRKDSCLTVLLIYRKLEVICEVKLASVQFSSVTQLCPTLWTPWIPARQASLSITNSRSSLRFTSIESMMPSSHIILSRPLLRLPPIPPSIRVFSSESTLGMRWPKYWSFSFSIIPSKEIPGLISFRLDWLDLLAVQGTLKSLLQHRSSKASTLLIDRLPEELWTEVCDIVHETGIKTIHKKKKWKKAKC